MPVAPLGDPITAPTPAVPGHEPLVGRYVSLLPPDPASDAVALYSPTHDTAEGQAVWDYMPYGPFPDQAALTGEITRRLDSSDPLFFSVHDHQRGEPVGMLSYLRINPTAYSIEIGHIFYVPAVQRTRINTEAVFLLIDNAFQLGYRRVEWKCNALNQRSRQAALRLGFSFEGIFRQHMTVKGRNRDTAWFSILDREWPLLRENHHRWLTGASDESLFTLNARVPRYCPG